MTSGTAENLRRRNIRLARRARIDFLKLCGPPRWAKRHREVLALPRKRWKGREVERKRRRLIIGVTCDQCHKVRWVGDYLIWHLISLRRFLCEWCLVRG